MSDTTGGCAGKTPYTSKTAAWAVLKHRERRGATTRQGRGVCEPYRCEHCEFFHVGTKKRKPKPIRVRAH